MRHTAKAWLMIILLMVFCRTVLAEEMVVQIIVPNCSACGSDARLRSLLKKIDGLKKYEKQGQAVLIMTFDDKRTSLDIILRELKEGHFLVMGEPKYLKQGTADASRQDKYCFINGNAVTVLTEKECSVKGGSWIKEDKALLPPVSLEVRKEKLQENNLRGGHTAPPGDLFGSDTMYR
ncbi:MAG: hypothetical protein K4571_04585 [Deltaproteobacteria bacterium]